MTGTVMAELTSWRPLRTVLGVVSARPIECVLLLLAPLLWISPAWKSFWLDEGITYWIIKDGPGEAIRRTLEYQGQSPVYFLVAWLTMALGGRSEFVLRIPSLIATALATWTMYRLGRRLVDEDTAYIATILFAYWIYLASSMPHTARPYALAMLAVTAATLVLIRWLDSNRRRDALVYVGLATLLLYIQPLYAGLFGIHLVAALEFRRRGKTSVTVLKFCAAVGMAGLLALPLVPQLVHFSGLLGSVFRSAPSLGSLYVVSSVLYPAAVIGMVLLLRRRLGTTPPLFVFVWCAAPIFWLLAVTLVAGDVGPVGRYTYWQFPGLVLVIAAAVRALSPRIRTGVLILIVLIGFTQVNRRALEDWRQATALARPLIESSETPVLVRSGLPLARAVDWLQHREHAEHVLAPLAYYPLPGATRALPYDIDEDYLQRVIVPASRSHDRIVILSQDFNFERMERLQLKESFDRHLPGHRSRTVARIDNLVLIVYDRR